MGEIQHRYTGDVLFSGGCSVKELVERNKESLREANLREANLRGANLREANLRGANLYEANLYGADLYGADLRGANLRGANLREANLREANLYGADLYGADLRGADLRGANLRGAELRGARYGEEYLLKCLSINTIGSRNDALQVWITKENVHLQTGCWAGTPEELLERTEREDYRLVVQCILGLAEMVRNGVGGE